MFAVPVDREGIFKRKLAVTSCYYVLAMTTMAGVNNVRAGRAPSIKLLLVSTSSFHTVETLFCASF
jgi:hypothetical protein